MGGDKRRAHPKGRAAAAEEEGAEEEEEEEEEGAEAGIQGAEEDLGEFAPEGVGDKMKRRDFKQMAAVQQQQQKQQQRQQQQLQQQKLQQQQQQQQGARANSKVA